MVNISALEHKQKDILLNLSEEDLKQYILYLTNSYYVSFKNNDVKAYEYNLNLLNDVVGHYKDKYPNIIGFVYYNLFINANVIIAEASDSTVKLIKPFKYGLYESEEMEEELTHDIKKIFNKDRIRARYNEKSTNKTSE